MCTSTFICTYLMGYPRLPFIYNLERILKIHTAQPKQYTQVWCFVYLLQFDTRRFYPYVSVLLLGHWNHHMIVLVPMKQPWKLWINSSHEHVKNNHDVNAKNRSRTNMSRDELPMFKMNFLLIKYIIYYIVVIAACCAISRKIEHYTLIWLS